MKNQLMVDLETMGVNQKAPIVSIGVVQFDLKTGETGKHFYQTINLESSIAAGLICDASTIKWWMEQEEGTRQKLFKQTENLKEVLHSLAEWMEEIITWDTSEGNLELWGNSAAFDLGILRSSYEAVGLPIPWIHWNERCLRTVASLNPVIKQSEPKPKGAHDPVIDCYYQINYLIKTLRSFKK